MDNMKEILSPEGFKELYEYLNKENGEVKAEDIQEHLKENHQFSSGKITGIIKRAVDKKLIEKVKRGTYKLNDAYVHKANGSEENVMIEINNEISKTVDKIQEIIAKKFTIIDTNTFVEIKDKIKKLTEIAK